MPQIHLTTQQQEQFYAKVSTTPTARGCLEWLGSHNREGYGYWVGHYYAHRVAWVLANGQIPHGMIVCHHCDNPSCVNPDHLFLGSHADNMRDMDTKGRRGKRGKLTATQVLDIRSEKFADWLPKDIAQHFGISLVHTKQILCRKVWTNI